MHDQLDKVDEIRGSLLVEGKEIGECVAKIRYNPYKLNEMEAELFDPPDFRKADVSDFSFANLETISTRLVEKNENRSRVLHLKTAELASAGFSYSKEVSVTSYRSSQFFEPQEECSEVTVYYLFPLTGITKSGLRPTKDPRHGFYRGEPDQEGVVDLNPNTFKLETSMGSAEMVEFYTSHRLSRKSKYPVTAVVNHSGLGFKSLDCSTKSYEKVLERLQEVVDRVMLIVSFVEQDRIEWSRERATLKSKEGKMIGEKINRRWSPPPTDRYHANYRTMKKPQQTFRTILGAYRSLSKDKADVTQALRNFTTAYTRTTIETGLIYWHSCLDHICEELYEEEDGSFSERIVNVCDSAQIETEDLLDQRVMKHWRQNLNDDHNMFRFVETRNTFVHDHFNTTLGEGYRVLEDRRTARALAERLLLAKMNIDPGSVPLGDPKLL